MRYVESRLKQKSIDETYRILVTEDLRIISENTAKTGGGSYTKAKYYDLVHPPKMDKRPVQEIVDDIISRIESEE